MFLTMYKRELCVASRNLKTPLAILGNNCVLAFVAVFSYYLEFESHGRMGQLVNGRSILEIYTLLSLIEFGVVVVSMLLLTVPCVLKERKNHSFDLLLSAGIKPASFLWAKLIARVTIVMSVVFSACPILGIVYYIGGVSLKNMFEMMLVLTIISFYMGAIGLFCSSYCRHNMTATVCAYLFGFLTIVGTLLLVSGIYLMRKVDLGIDVEDAKSAVFMGKIILLLLVNPLYSFLRLLNGQLGTMKEMFAYVDTFQGQGTMVEEQWIFLSCSTQILCAFAMISFSARRLCERKRIKKTIFK